MGVGEDLFFLLSRFKFWCDVCWVPWPFCFSYSSRCPCRLILVPLPAGVWIQTHFICAYAAIIGTMNIFF